MGKSQKQKGYRGEYNLVKILNEYGIDAKRVPLSGQTEFAKGDVIIKGKTKTFTCEVKVRANGFKQIYDWLEGKDILFIKSDYKNYLVVLPLDMLIQIIEDKIYGGVLK